MRRGLVAGLALAVSIGLAAGVGGFTFVYARGASYLTNDPAACANCHVMDEYYAGWMKSSHRAVATCNDCHTPPGLVPKYATKASNAVDKLSPHLLLRTRSALAAGTAKGPDMQEPR